MKETSVIDYALVAAGGRGARLIEGGIDVPLAKSFLPIEGKPLLYWHMVGLLDAGVTQFIISTDSREKVRAAGKVADDVLSGHSAEAVIYQDHGPKTHNVPHEVRDMLPDEFLFTFGHQLTVPEDYRHMSHIKSPKNVVLSGFPSKGLSDHPVVRISPDTGIVQSSTLFGAVEVAEVGSPFVFDQQWVDALPGYEYKFTKLVPAIARGETLFVAVVVPHTLPMEFDTRPEYDTAVFAYEEYLKCRGERT